jgi:hypothetical protein
MSHENKTDAAETGQATQEPSRMGYSGFQSVQSGRPGRGQTSVLDQEGDSGGALREDPPELRGDLRVRRHPRIPGTRVIDPSEVLLQSFLDGDVEKAYQSALELKSAYHEALDEASRLRYRINFGTEACSNCDGLKAGPGVVATCFQVQKCNFDSIHEGSESPSHLRILDRLALK